jgi:uncharacterized membrane protein (UPF0127 family)
MCEAAPENGFLNDLGFRMRFRKAPGMTKLVVIVPAAFGLLAGGCREELPAPQNSAAGSAATATNAATPFEHASPTQPQPRLPTIKLWIGSNELTAEVAATMKEVETGMMWRTNLEEMEGMIFLFARPHQTRFWMRNTLIPLSCAYINPEGIILELHDMKPRDETGIPAATDQVQFVLEVNQGWFQRHNVTPGMLVKSDRGTLLQLTQKR